MTAELTAPTESTPSIEAPKQSLATMKEICDVANRGGVSPLRLFQSLARQFPCLKGRWWVREDRLLSYDDIPVILKGERRAHQMCEHATLFCLSVYNCNEWSKKFNFVRAMSEMNSQDWRVILEWAENRFYL